MGSGVENWERGREGQRRGGVVLMRIRGGSEERKRGREGIVV